MGLSTGAYKAPVSNPPNSLHKKDSPHFKKIIKTSFYYSSPPPKKKIGD